MSSLTTIIQNKGEKRLLSTYFTAGYPMLNSTLDIAEALEKADVDFLEIGFPYSDPVADGPVIQRSSEIALQNGMTLDILFEQLAELRKRISIPVFLMGYFNPVLQYGVERFCQSCKAAGIDGVIVPDLPMYEYEELYKNIFEENGISNIFLLTPQTSEERARKIDKLSTSFIYLLSSSATTGKNLSVGSETEAYFKRVQSWNLKSPLVVGFGIADQAAFNKATDYADAAIVGSALVKRLSEPNYLANIPEFIAKLRDGEKD